MSITTILTSLDNLEKLHRSLLRIAYDKTAVIKSGDMEGLDQLLKEEQSHLAAILQTEGQRQRDVAQFLTDQGRSVPANPTVADLLTIVTSESDKQSLTEARDRLLHAIHDLKWQNDLNQKLTYQSLQIVNLSLDMVRPHTESLNYSKTEINGVKVSEKKTTFDSHA